MAKKFEQFYGDYFQPELMKEIQKVAVPKTVKAKTHLLEIGDYIRSMPFVLSGSIKTLRKDPEGSEIFLYFINPGETCAMTLSCCLGHKKSEIKAVAQTDVELWLIPIQKMEEWSGKYKTWRHFIFENYHKQLIRSLETIDKIAFKKLDQRLLTYLQEQRKIMRTDDLKITHQEIANDLNSSRVVISRLLKKLENKNGIEIKHNLIKLKHL